MGALVAIESSDLTAVIAENKRDIVALDLARLALGELTPEGLQSKHPDLRLSQALADTVFADAVEEWSNNALLQERALNAKLERALSGGIDVLSEKLSAPDLSATAAKDISETLLKVSGAMDRRAETQTKTRPTLRWALRGLGYMLVVQSPFAPSKTYDSGLSESALLAPIVRELRCISLAEAQQVARVLKQKRDIGIEISFNR